MGVINWSLIKNPLNWLTVWSMILILGFLLNLFSQYAETAKK